MTNASTDGLGARIAARDLLRAVLGRKRALDEVLDRTLDAASLAPRDRAFVRLLTATTLRRLGQIDALIDQMLEMPLPPTGTAARDALRLGAAQLLFLGTPPHAAVDTSVALVDRGRDARFKGLVNAVLRRLDREGAALVTAQDAARLNTPDWLWNAWTAAYGEDTARAVADAHLTEAPLDITPKGDPAGWAERLDATLLPSGSLRRAAGGAVPDLPGFGEGAWWVQDAAAALPARLMGDVAGLRVADLCAAPGGKTAQLCAAGARVTAVDRSEGRLARVRANLDRLGLEAELVAADAAIFRPAEPFDAVLLDAPCSATGTIRRHPDIPRLKSPEDVEKLAAAQARLLDHAVTLVRPGGILVWCTCSLQPEEGERQIASLLERAGNAVRRDPVRAEEIGGLAEAVTAEGEIRTLPSMLPGEGGLDGFHIARLRRFG
ncbi:transcription antitermination factor NusB [Inquilinus sp. CAU 1745]|uniref:RsmB/NOP family class I SAM-dependent RNA methyltransferase n=1 Tax=Inquilinus sp. CAU 1745 TaxID=3140369 RepID=UPI00325C00B4